MKRHRCHRLPKNLEIAYDHAWKTWALFTNKDAIDVLYCPWCSLKLDEKLGNSL